MLNKFSLRTKLTIFTGLLIILVSALLTGISIGNLGYGLSTMSVPAVPALDAGNAAINLIDSKTAIYNVKQEFAHISIIWMVIIIVIGIGMIYFILGKALKPITTLNTIVKSINENNLSTRINTIRSNDEVGSLANSFNIMLDRLNNSFENQKQFAANAAHELKTPLTTIKAGIQVLKMDHEPTLKEYKENIDITQQSTERLIKVVDELLNLASKKSECFSDEVVLQQVIQNILNELRLFIDEKAIRVSFESCGYSFIGNKNLIYRALYNLIENAAKYNIKGGQIKIYSEVVASKIVIHIQDTGMGIADSELRNIFEPFYRVDKSRSREIAGSGLGLSIVKTIIEKHSGYITVNSQTGVGTTFSVELPNYY